MQLRHLLFALLLFVTVPNFAQPNADAPPPDNPAVELPADLTATPVPAAEVKPSFDLTTKLAGSLTLLDSLQALLVTLNDPAARAVVEQTIEKFKDTPEKAEGFEGWVNYITGLAVALGAALVYLYKFAKDRLFPAIRGVSGKKKTQA